MRRAQMYVLALCGLAMACEALAVPIGYRYVGSRVVSGGRHVYWYWNAEHDQSAPDGTAFVARMYARNVELNEERAYVALVRCDTRTYRQADAPGPFQAIEEGDPVLEVWRAGCEGTRVAPLAMRLERVNGGAATLVPVPLGAVARSNNAQASAATPGIARHDATLVASPSVNVPTIAGEKPDGAARPSVPAPAQASPSVGAKDDARRSTAAPASLSRSVAAAPAGRTDPAGDASRDPRRVDQCIRFAERKSGAGDGTIANVCTFDVEVAYCYREGRGGAFDCRPRVRGMRTDSVAAGASKALPEYTKGINKGVALVACRGTYGQVIPRLDPDGKSGCF